MVHAVPLESTGDMIFLSLFPHEENPRAFAVNTVLTGTTDRYFRCIFKFVLQ